MEILKRMSSVLLKFKEQVLFWPESDERIEIANRIQTKFMFPNCVGITDGTLLPFELKPQLNGEDYFCRKSCYALHALITCDDTGRIRDVVIGWPGSVHDNRVWTTSDLFINRASNFAPNEYLLGDSAFQPSSVMISAFKKPRGCSYQQNHEFFNTLLAKPRVKSEHCIGILKGRFQYFKRIRALLSRKQDLQKVIDFFNCACILHNWLIKDPVPLNWIEIDIEEDDVINRRIPENEEGNSRRSQMLGYLLEKNCL